jgi:outer membrane receptor for ferrienterochelin and colicin
VPSKIRTYELNYNGLIGSNFSTHISIFRNELKNLISQYFLNLTDTTTVYYSSNKGEIITHGAEVSLNYNLNKNIMLSTSLTYQVSEDMTSGIEKVDVAYSPSVLGYFKINYTFLKNYSIFASGKYVSSSLPEYDYKKQARLGKETPPYTEINTGLQVKNLILKGLGFKFYITNLANTKIFYPVTTLNQFADKGLLGFQRRFFISLKYEF